MRSARLVVVTGPSGSGKSSLVRAGLVPALIGRGRAVTVFTPGGDADAALTTATLHADDGAVLVIDQFEELFTLASATEDVAAFLSRVAAYAVDRGPVVITIRDDQLSGLTHDQAFSRLAEQGLHLVGPLTGDHLREAIEGPAAQAGLRLEGGLVELLARDTEGEPGALPLLSHALAETWRRRDGNVLTVDGYQATGGISGAVARSADRLYESLPPDHRAILRSVMLRLVGPSPEGGPIRFRIDGRTLRGDADHERIVSLLVGARLVTTDADSVELAHEALARAWPRLQSWLDEDAAGQRTLRHLAAAAVGWDSLGRPTTELYRGARLEAALEWRDATQPDLTEVEVEFLRRVGRARVVRAHRPRGPRPTRRHPEPTTAHAARRRRRPARRGAARRRPRAHEPGRGPSSRPTSPARGGDDRADRGAGQPIADPATRTAARSRRCWPSRPTGGRPGRWPTRPCSAPSPPIRRSSATPTSRASRLVVGAAIPGTDDAVVALDGKDLAVVTAGRGRRRSALRALRRGVRRLGRSCSASAPTVDGWPSSRCGTRTTTAWTSRRSRTLDGEGCALLSVYDIATGPPADGADGPAPGTRRRRPERRRLVGGGGRWLRRRRRGVPGRRRGAGRSGA